MTTFTVSFFGHRIVEDPLTIESKLDALIRRLLLTKPDVEFLVGRDGDFDQLVSSAICKAKRTVRDDSSSHVWVLPMQPLNIVTMRRTITNIMTR